MMSHMDSDFPPRQGTLAKKFMDELTGRAEKIKSQEGSKITSGFDGEPVKEKWEANGFQVVQRPDDPQSILRISIGGGEDLPVSLNYCVFRGDREQCITLLKKAVVALEADHD